MGCSRIIEQENGNEKSTGKEHFMYLQKTKATAPDGDKSFANLIIFHLNRFIIKAHYLSRSMFLCQRARRRIE